MRLLAVESSCDETAAAVLEDERVLSSVVSTQVAIHATFGGVVPELASRNHALMIMPVIQQALAEAHTPLDKIEAVAATYGPGLIGSLLVGLQAAKGIAYARGLPFVGVHHLAGHLAAIHLHEAVAYPYVGLACSGGHTALYVVEESWNVRLLGETRDDAAGEAFDKTAKLVGLGYPGGAVMDRLAETGDPRRFTLPRAMLGSGQLDFSFSGIKTAARQLLTRHGAMAGQDLADFCASVREAIVDVLVRKTLLAAAQTGIPRVVLAGGVAANSLLRRRMAEDGRAARVAVHIPPLSLCTDNAAMIGMAGLIRLRAGHRDPLDLDADPSADL